jgi:decaprenylphospho-beta-D-erythro-pentofuranosid-2-ulose 2-reductase
VNVAFLGATKGMGRALARLLAERGDQLVLMGRDLVDLERSAHDLAARCPAAKRATVVHCDLADPSTFAPALDAARRALSKLDAVIVTAALFAPQRELEADTMRLEELLTVDFTNTVLFCEAARKLLLEGGGGTLCVFSSVAGERGRKPVLLYGAAKAGLTHYLEGLDHKFRQAGLKVVCVKPGFVKTSMTAGSPPPPFAGEPDRVARDVLRALDRATPVVYTPGAWRFIMFIIRWLPRAVMRRIEF